MVLSKLEQLENLEEEWKNLYIGYCTLCKRKITNKKKAQYLISSHLNMILNKKRILFFISKPFFSLFCEECGEKHFEEIGWVCERCNKKIMYKEKKHEQKFEQDFGWKIEHCFEQEQGFEDFIQGFEKWFKQWFEQKKDLFK